MSFDKPPQKCAARVMETIPLLMRFIRSDMRNHSADSLTIPQLRSLAFLKRNPGTSLSAVAEHLGVTCATASTTIERLVQRHLVQRTDHPQERRKIVLNLTTQGKSLLEESQEKTRLHIAEIIESLTSEELLQIETSLTLLKNVFEKTESNH
ncbi:MULTISPECIES: MarR family winged helix-turn-helix transcriptional regulator [Cylindrospermopsis]|uniref:MarR family transcriptional regulator n=1 Tax=Cylindrospermopsis curvispora GIHE-G1 TaxID=2666332 RepID=A0A7H0EX58_9CYAN|nr:MULTISPECIES: MarR family transcriptional regulator [Cylindrospermopsis]OHY41640.1 MarR family transcriptional regulator [Cylindrospermopsis raciborskii CS-508]QNP28374.1 MarR family transcriptional regulator [Cylindrospermopsis curvispora GIHE-G1]UJL34693.1 MarR family transcriptional regulator [Cylindrospermopsis raciborskii Cr2010]BAZ91159.1 MarR family transcriptional regulator [Raphidiopsis curvata NIES-932]